MKKNIVYIVCGIALLYLIVCWIDIASHNNSSQKYGKWNIIYILFNKQETTEDDITTSEYPTEIVTTEATTEEVTTEVTTVAKRTVTTEQATVTTSEAMAEITTEEVTIAEYIPEATTEEITTIEQQTEAPTVVATATDADVDDYEMWLLAHLINGEAGAAWCSDTTRYYVGSVVLNRVNHAEFPDSIEGVIYQSGQYACTWDGNFYLEPSDRCWEISRDLLANGSVLPADVVFQANFTQGSGVYDCIDGVYFCYR